MRAEKQPLPLIIGRIGAPTLWERWPEARAMLDPALERSDETWEKVECALCVDDMQLWCVLEGHTMRAATVTRIAQTKRGEVVEVFVVGGRGMEDWLPSLSGEIERQAREIGCIGMRAYGRLGWKNQLTEIGWRVTSQSYEKDF